jgi:AcrR family transcriptional regulator
MPRSTPTAAARRAVVAAHRIEARRSQILTAATELMQDVGFHAMSMQALAERAEVSVGLTYSYFGGKHDVLRAVIVDILEDFSRQVPVAVAAAGDDPVARLQAGVIAFCEIIDAKRAGAELAYRESATLDADGRAAIKALELQTSEPLREAVRDGIAAGVFRDVDVELVVHNVVMAAHGWALKHWHLAPRMSLPEYAAGQAELILAALVRSPPPPRP